MPQTEALSQGIDRIFKMIDLCFTSISVCNIMNKLYVKVIHQMKSPYA